MREQVKARLGLLRDELEKGQAEFNRLEKQQSQLRDTVLRISGAIQVLEEVLAEGQMAEQNGPLPRSAAEADTPNTDALRQDTHSVGGDGRNT